METKITQGTITDKKEYTGNSSGAPKGDFYINNDKFACWKQEDFDKIEIGDEVGIEYTEKENVTPDKTYINRSITKIALFSEEVVTATGLEVEHIKIADESKQSVTQIYKIGNLEYEVTLRLLNGN